MVYVDAPPPARENPEPNPASSSHPSRSSQIPPRSTRPRPAAPGDFIYTPAQAPGGHILHGPGAGSGSGFQRIEAGTGPRSRSQMVYEMRVGYRSDSQYPQKEKTPGNIPGVVPWFRTDSTTRDPWFPTHLHSSVPWRHRQDPHGRRERRRGPGSLSGSAPRSGGADWHHPSELPRGLHRLPEAQEERPEEAGEPGRFRQALGCPLR
jgi:hypothetical protein